MKNQLHKIFLLLAVLLYGMSARADGLGVGIGPFWYFLNRSTYEAEVYAGYARTYSGPIEIPSSVVYDEKVYSVTAIGLRGFKDCTGITSVKIPTSCKSIDECAFSGCTSLTSISLPTGLTSIGYSAFEYCTSLTSIEIPAGVTSIGCDAFYGCSRLVSIHVDENNTVFSSADSVIYDKDQTAVLFVPPGIQGDLTFPASVTIIGECVAMGCSGLTSVEIPLGVTEIGAEAFSLCFNLSTVELPASLTRIGLGAFVFCENLQRVTCHAEIPPTCDVVALEHESSTCTLYVPAGSEEAYAQAEGWNNFTDIRGIIENGGEDDIYCDFNEEEKTATIISFDLSEREDGRMAIPDSVTHGGENYAVTAIASEAFKDWTKLVHLEIPAAVKSIGERAFAGCTSLVDVSVLPATTQRVAKAARSRSRIAAAEVPAAGIGSQAFMDCTSLASVEIPTGITAIGNEAFADCMSLTFMEIPASVTTIGSRAFAGCEKLDRISCLAETPPACADATVFDGVNVETCVVEVPADAEEAYAVAEVWKDFFNTEEPPTGIHTAHGNGSATIIGYYTPSGHKLSQPQRGVNVVRYADGTTRKVLVK